MKKPYMLFLLAAFLLATSSCFLFRDHEEEEPESINVLLLTVDALRPANMSCYGYQRPTTPNLDRFAREGALFTTVVSSCAWTNPSLLSILTSRLPSFHGVTLRGQNIRNGIATLPLVLKHQGYRVPSLSYLNEIPNFFGIGFDPVPAAFYRHVSGDKLKHWLRHRPDGKFFIWSHYRYIHLPYNPSPPYDRMFPGQSSCPETDFIRRIRTKAIIPADTVGHVSQEEKACVVDLYDGEVRQMDDYFGEIMEILEQTGEKDRTLVIVTADHGEELFEHGMVGHASTSQRGTLYEEEIRIPLLLRLPGKIPEGVKVGRFVRNIDIMPTVLDLLEVPQPPGLQGRSLRPLLKGERMPEVSAVCETVLGGYLATPEDASNHMKCIRTENWKFTMLFGRGEPVFSLYDLLMDPEEKINLYGTAGTPGENLKKELMAHIASIPPLPKRFGSTGRKPPAGTEMPRIMILTPQEGTVLHFEEAHGTVELSWAGDAELAYRIEYDVGENEFHLEGEFEVQGNRMLFGPYTTVFWQDLVPWNPFRFRVGYGGSDPGWSPWVTFTIEE